LSEASRESIAEGPFLQEMPSEQVRGQLMRASVVLTKAAAAVAPHHRRAERDCLRAAAVRHYHETKLGEHQRVLQRHKIIEDRKEYIERLNIVREEEEQR
jgi:translation initiation factor 3 subunit A